MSAWGVALGGLTTAIEGRRFASAGAVVVAALAAHVGNVGSGLVYDDWFWIAEARWSPPQDVFEVDVVVFRPVLGAFFEVFQGSTDPLGYHLVALACLVGAAVAVWWFATELGLPPLAAAVAGSVTGAHAALGTTTIWVSAFTSSLAVLLAASAAALAVRNTGRWTQAGAAVCLFLAMCCREAPLIVPAATLVLLVLAQPGTPAGTQLRRTAPLWVAAGAFFVFRTALGQRAGPTSPYYVDPFGAHVVDNVRQLLGIIAQGGYKLVTKWWDVVFWAAAALVAALAWRRGNRLVVAGLAFAAIAMVPPSTLPNHSMETYYVDLALIGVSIAVGGLIRSAPKGVGVAVLAGIVVAGPILMAAYRGRIPLNQQFARNEVLVAIAEDAEPVAERLVVTTTCERDAELSRNGDLFRVVLDDEDLEVDFVVEGDGGGC